MVDESVSELARRLDAVEHRLARLDRGGAVTAPPPDDGTGGPLWVLDGLRSRLPADGGAVLIAGVVPLPTGEQYVWQYGRSTDELLSASWSELSAAIAALGHPVRLRLAHLVLTGSRSVAELQSVDGLGTSGQLYHHLRQLVAAGWLVHTARGHYGVPGDRVVPLLALITAAERPPPGR